MSTLPYALGHHRKIDLHTTERMTSAQVSDLDIILAIQFNVQVQDYNLGMCLQQV